MKAMIWGLAKLTGYLVLISSVQAQDGVDPSGLKIKYLDAKDRIETKAEGERAKLFTSYAAAVEKLLVDFQGKADLENALKAKNEVTLAKEKQEVGTEEFPGIASLRKSASDALAKIEDARSADLGKLNDAYLAKMTEFKTALTKAGDLERALAIDKEIKAVQASASTPASDSGTTASAIPPAAAGLAPPPTGPVRVSAISSYVNDTPLEADAMITKETVLDAGRHRLKGRVTLGDRKLPVPQRVSKLLVAPSGTTLQGGEIYVDLGEMHATESRFDEVRLMANLGGQTFATACLFDESTIQKAGGWSSGYSSKWTLHNCVFRKTLAGGEFNRGSVGLKLTFCTFIDLDFPELVYANDAGKEAQEVWRVIENCRFVDCEIPHSALLATRNCVFENCKFIPDEKSQPLGETKLSVTLYHNGSAFEAPPAFGNGAFTVADGRSLTPKPGSTVTYKASSSGLIFE